MHLGVDIVQISKFAERIRLGGETFLSKVFLPHESDGADIERLAGTFAAKEAACKALGIPAGNWLSISLSRDAGGAPHLTTTHPGINPDSIEVSISHDGDYAIAVVIVS